MNGRHPGLPRVAALTIFSPALKLFSPGNSLIPANDTAGVPPAADVPAVLMYMTVPAPQHVQGRVVVVGLTGT